MSTRSSGELANTAERAIAASRRTSATPPGPSEAPRPEPALVEAINQVFALFRLNYNNQYYAAFSDAEQLKQTKKLWLESLRAYPPAQLLQGARRAIETSDYLPGLSRMRRCCEESLGALGLPDARDAYREASSAASPPEARDWSHPVVYWAGRDAGWRFLATTTESEGWPRFNHAYQARCAALLRGETLPPVPPPPAPALQAQPLSHDQALATLRRLRREYDL